MIPVEVEVPVPYDQIDAFVAQKKKQLEDEAAAKAKEAEAKAKEAAAKAAAKAAADAAEAARKALPETPTLKF